jgi:7SK snRNA methylphosphate capping enzyme
MVHLDYSGPATTTGSAIHVKDPRLQLIDGDLVPNLFRAKHCLDIGCNAGGVSCQLGKRKDHPCSDPVSDYTFCDFDIDHFVAFDYNAASVTGVDIDPKLVGQSNKLRALRASRARPPTKDSDRIVDWFPMSAVQKYGYIEPEFDPSRGANPASTQSQWPPVSFHSADWATGQDFTGPYDVILALSVRISRCLSVQAKIVQVIKWIHLEHLDQGLETFFRKCASSLSPDGYLIIELQTWDSYEKAVRPQKAPHYLDSLRQLRYRPETSFDDLLAGEGLYLCASSLALPRPIKVYRKERPVE